LFRQNASAPSPLVRVRCSRNGLSRARQARLQQSRVTRRGRRKDGIAKTDMEITERAATTAEIQQKFRHISLFELRLRRAAQAEADRGMVEVLVFDVVRAWKLFSCSGPPCCSNEWLLQTSAGELVQIDSWSMLHATKQTEFPGCRLVVTRWPRTHRVIHAEVSGVAIQAEEVASDSWIDLGKQNTRCEVLGRSELPPEVRSLIE